MPTEAGRERPRVHEAVRALLDDRPDADASLEAVLDVDAEQETWTFDDVPVDSGIFGELVSRDIVEKADGEYRIADRDAVRAALDGESVDVVDDGTSSPERFAFDLAEVFDARAMAGLAGALVFLFVMRITAYKSVFRGEHVVSPGNDPYYFRYWMEEFLARSSGATDWSVIANMPDGVGQRRPLSHAANWFIAELLGGGQEAAAQVAAWLPVVATLALGVVLYKLATVLTDDPRVGVASVFVLATIPAHAVYTGVGFLDHQLHQYLWLATMVLALTWLAVDLRERREEAGSVDAAIRAHLSSARTWGAVVALGVSTGFSAHAWGGSPLTFVPVAAYLGLRAAMDARDDVSPALANLPAVLGLGLGSAVSHLFHARWGWHEAYAAYTPGMVFGGAVAVMALGEFWRRFDGPLGALVALEAIVPVGGLWLFRRLRSEDVAELRRRADELFFREGITETQSLFAAEYGFVFGPLTQTGLAFYLALVPLGWATWVAYRRYEPGWLLLAVFGWYWTVLAGIQMRFTGQLSLFIAVLGGLGLVHVLSTVDLVRTPVPFRDEGERRGLSGSAEADDRASVTIAVPDDRGKVAYLVGIFVLFAGLGMLLVPSLVSQVTYSEAEYEAAMAMAEHSEDAGREYPENYVLSEWDRNRMYNYFVNGEARMYTYAANNYGDLQSSESLDKWYGQSRGRTGYVVLNRESKFALNEDKAPSHYQIVHVDKKLERTVLAVVPGARIHGTGESGQEVVVETSVTVAGESFSYRQSTTVRNDGTFRVVVAYPGTYEVGDKRVEVSTDDIYDGEAVLTGS